MQIHEITKRPQRTDEGILDDLKAAVTAAKTGYKAGGLKGVAKNLTSRTAYNQALQQNQRADTMKDLDKLEKKWGTPIKRPLGYYVDQLKTPTKPEFKDEAKQAEQQRDSLTPEFTDTFINDEPAADQAAPGQADQATQATQPVQSVQPVQPTAPVADQGSDIVMPEPNTRFRLPSAVSGYPTDYFMSDKGIWTNDQTPPQRVTNKPTIDKLNNMVDAGAAKVEKVDAPPEPTTGKGKGGKKAVKESHALSERASAARTARRAAARNGTAAPAGAPAQKKPKANLKSDFGQWVASRMGSDYQSVIANSVVKSELTKIFNAMTQNKDPKMNSEYFKRYILIVQAAILKSKVEQGIDNDEGQSNTDDELAQFQGQAGKKTGNAKLDQMLQQKLKMNLSESQVAVSKDIHVKSSLGDYVKRASDQQWYDPKGVLISQEKYPDFVKKLDATPAAQTAYQSALSNGGGSDSAYIKAQVDARVKAELDAQAKKAVAKAEEMHPPEPPPQATAADWELYKAQANRINNQMIDKTINDLRNAEYFNTGQQDYLKQQMAQLMAKKF